MSISQLNDNCRKISVAPAKAGTQWCSLERRWIPAFAGMTVALECAVVYFGNSR